MKRLVFAILTAAVVALPVCAQSVTAAADVPFAFIAGNATMPAGQYKVALSSDSFAVTLAGPDSTTHFLMSVSDDTRSSADQPVLVFHRYGDQYFISGIRTATVSREFSASRMELEAQKTAGAARPSEKIVLAMR